jgi:uncharacterized protein (TIGR00730 family)
MDENNNPIIAVFGSSHPNEGDADYVAAFEMGVELANAGFVICNGGYGGVMEASARGAKSVGGRTIGVTSKSFGARLPNKWIDQNIVVEDLVERLLRLIHMADAYVALKGGTGTLLELAAVWEFMNKHIISIKPIIIVGDFWEPVTSTLRTQLREEGLREAADFVIQVTDPKHCVALLRQILKRKEQ